MDKEKEAEEEDGTVETIMDNAKKGSKLHKEKQHS